MHCVLSISVDDLSSIQFHHCMNLILINTIIYIDHLCLCECFVKTLTIVEASLPSMAQHSNFTTGGSQRIQDDDHQNPSMGGNAFADTDDDEPDLRGPNIRIIEFSTSQDNNNNNNNNNFVNSVATNVNSNIDDVMNQGVINEFNPSTLDSQLLSSLDVEVAQRRLAQAEQFLRDVNNNYNINNSTGNVIANLYGGNRGGGHYGISSQHRTSPMNTWTLANQQTVPIYLQRPRSRHDILSSQQSSNPLILYGLPEITVNTNTDQNGRQIISVSLPQSNDNQNTNTLQQQQHSSTHLNVSATTSIRSDRCWDHECNSQHRNLAQYRCESCHAMYVSFTSFVLLLFD